MTSSVISVRSWFSDIGLSSLFGLRFLQLLDNRDVGREGGRDVMGEERARDGENRLSNTFVYMYVFNRIMPDLIGAYYDSPA